VKTRQRLLFRLAIAVMAVSAALMGITSVSASSSPAAAPAARHICYQAYVQDIGWQGVVCDGFVAGTEHQSRRMEALSIGTSGVGGVCADAYLQDIGWQGWRCAKDGSTAMVGTTGQSRRMEALAVQVGTGTVCADAYLQDMGWQGTVCGNPAIVGTEHQSRRMEAITITV
jgi:uncharacterized protein YjdB